MIPCSTNINISIQQRNERNVKEMGGEKHCQLVIRNNTEKEFSTFNAFALCYLSLVILDKFQAGLLNFIV